MTTSSPAPPDWYPDPRGAGRLRYWDGAAWTEHEAPVAPPTSTGSVTYRPALPGWWRGLAVGLQVLLTLSGLVFVAQGVLGWWAASLLSGWSDGVTPADVTLGERIDLMTLTLGLLGLVLLVAGGVAFVTWLFTAHRSDRMDARLLEHGSGWAIGGWFVPFLNLVRPWHMVREVHRGASPRPEWPDRLPQRLIGWWWLSWLLSGLVGQVSWVLLPDQRLLDSDRPEAWNEFLAQLRRSYETDIVVGVVGVVSAVLAILVVRRVSRAVLSARPR